MKIVAYNVIHGANLHWLLCYVEDAMNSGWQPLGGVSHVAEVGYVQAVVKYNVEIAGSRNEDSANRFVETQEDS